MNEYSIHMYEKCVEIYSKTGKKLKNYIFRYNFIVPFFIPHHT